MLDAFHIVSANLLFLGKALLVTIELNLASIALALVLGTVMGIGRVYGGRWIDRAFGFVIDVVRSIPILVIMVWVFFGLPLLLGAAELSRVSRRCRWRSASIPAPISPRSCAVALARFAAGRCNAALALGHELAAGDRAASSCRRPRSA